MIMNLYDSTINNIFAELTYDELASVVASASGIFHNFDIWYWWIREYTLKCISALFIGNGMLSVHPFCPFLLCMFVHVRPLRTKCSFNGRTGRTNRRRINRHHLEHNLRAQIFTSTFWIYYVYKTFCLEFFVFHEYNIIASRTQWGPANAEPQLQLFTCLEIEGERKRERGRGKISILKISSSFIHT